MRIIVALALIIVEVLSIASFVVAQETQESNNIVIEGGTAAFPAAGLLPDNYMYGFQRFFEQLQLFFTFNSHDKANLHLQFAAKRLAELNQSIAEGKNQNMPGLEKDYENELNQTQREFNSTRALGQNVTALAEHVASETYKHTLVLQNLLNESENETRPGLENALNNSQKGHNNAVVSILENRNITGPVNITFAINGQTFTQTFNVTMEHGKAIIGIGQNRTQSHAGNETDLHGQNETESMTSSTTSTTSVLVANASCSCPSGFSPKGNGLSCVRDCSHVQGNCERDLVACTPD